MLYYKLVSLFHTLTSALPQSQWCIQFRRHDSSLLYFSPVTPMTIAVAITAARDRHGSDRQGPIWRYAVYATVTSALWCFGEAAFILSATNDTERWFWMIFAFCAQIACVPIIFIFALYYSQMGHMLTPTRHVLLWIPFVLAIVLAITNAWHSLIWDASLAPLSFQSGPGHGAYFFFIALVAYGLMLFTAAIFLQGVRHLHKIYQRQVILLIVAILLPLACSILYFTPFNPWPSVDLAPAAVSVSVALILVSRMRFRLLDLRPVYRDAVFEHMTEGAVILDKAGRIADINPAAQHFLATARQSVGDEAQTALASCFLVEGELELTPGAHHQLVTREKPPRHFDLRVAAISEEPAGLLLVWRDMTRLRLALATIRAQEHFLAARAEAEADFSREIDLAVTTLRSQVKAALNHLDHGRLDATATLLAEVDTVTAENLRRRTRAFFEAGTHSTGFFAALREYVALFAETHDLQSEIHIDDHLDVDQLTPAARLQAVRILQEALENVGRHAQAQHVFASITQAPSAIRLTVRDDGVGFDPGQQPEQTGIATMTRRAQVTEGTLTITTAPGAGVEVCAVFPAPVTATHLNILRGRRALLVVNHRLEREGLRGALLETGIDVMHSTPEPSALLVALQAARLDLVLLDIDVWDAVAPATLNHMRVLCPEARIIVLVEENHPNLAPVLCSDIDGYLLKTLPSGEFVDALARIVQGETGLAPRLSSQVMNQFRAQDDRPPHIRLLSARQQEILRLIGLGFTYPEIATRLQVGESDVRYHANQIRRHLGLANRSAIALYARRHHLCEPPKIAGEDHHDGESVSQQVR
ncbi:MAG: hypothetical protein IPK16_17870 [Anaerolineales bacterium]|nr:hypothetical protein [Anaerolineales bacterium]